MFVYYFEDYDYEFEPTLDDEQEWFESLSFDDKVDFCVHIWESLSEIEKDFFKQQEGFENIQTRKDWLNLEENEDTTETVNYFMSEGPTGGADSKYINDAQYDFFEDIAYKRFLEEMEESSAYEETERDFYRGRI